MTALVVTFAPCCGVSLTPLYQGAFIISPGMGGLCQAITLLVGCARLCTSIWSPFKVISCSAAGLSPLASMIAVHLPHSAAALPHLLLRHAACLLCTSAIHVSTATLHSCAPHHLLTHDFLPLLQVIRQRGHSLTISRRHVPMQAYATINISAHRHHHCTIATPTVWHLTQHQQALSSPSLPEHSLGCWYLYQKFQSHLPTN
jgi:hypothetical protein